jgi:ferric-dicitrate binding protein FerR (iron transport regulator)
MHLLDPKHVLIAILGGLLLLPAQSLGQTSSNVSQASADAESRANEGRPLAFVRQFKPQVDIFNRASQKYTTADQGERLFDGDTLATGDDGYAAVQFMDKSLAKVKPNSVLLVNGSVDDETQSTSTRILMEAGEIFMDVDDATRSDFDVATPNSVATVKGTQFGSSVEDTGESVHYVLEGTVEVLATESGQTEEIGAGMFAEVSADGEEITTGELEEDEQERRREEFEQVDEEMTPKTLELRFRDEDGNVRTIEIQYYENDDEQNEDNE